MSLSASKIAIMAVVAAAALAPAAPALAASAAAAKKPATTQVQSAPIPASWHFYKRYVSLDTCIAIGNDKVDSGVWQNWKCTYPSPGKYDLHGYY